METAEDPRFPLHCGWSSKKPSGPGEEGGGECPQLPTSLPACAPGAERVNVPCAGPVALLAVKIHSHTRNTTDCEM